MRTFDVDALVRLLAEVHGLELEAADLERTRALVASSLGTLCPFVEPSLFDTDPGAFAAMLDDLAEDWEPLP